MAEPHEIEHHYDVGNTFYQLMLDESMTYSCANFDDPSWSLEQAQAAKLELALRVSKCRPRERLLDVGSGWGSILRLARANGIIATGLTLSPAQQALCLHQGLDARLIGWQDFHPEEPFDGMTSIGAFEHFSPPTTDKEMRRTYRRFFKWAASVLKPEAGFYLQTITMEPHRPRVTSRDDSAFMMENIFPGSMMPRVEQVVEAASRYFEVRQVWCRRLDYMRTTAEWRDRLERNREACVAATDPGTYDRYRRYLDICVQVFRDRDSSLYQLALTRV